MTSEKSTSFTDNTTIAINDLNICGQHSITEVVKNLKFLGASQGAISLLIINPGWVYDRFRELTRSLRPPLRNTTNDIIYTWNGDIAMTYNPHEQFVCAMYKQITIISKERRIEVIVNTNARYGDLKYILDVLASNFEFDF